MNNETYKLMLEDGAFDIEDTQATLDKCPNCGRLDTLRNDVMKEEGQEYPIKYCIVCGWWK